MWRSGVLMAVVLTACTAHMSSFPLPDNVRVVAPDPKLPAELAALSGVWAGTLQASSGTSLGWIYEVLLIVETIGPEQAIVVHAWGNHPYFPDIRGWSRQKARVLPGPRIEWIFNNWVHSYQLSRDRDKLLGNQRPVGGGPKEGSVRMNRIPFETPPARRAAARPALPLAPTISFVLPSPDLPPPFTNFVGAWEGTWDNGSLSRLLVGRIEMDRAEVIYVWSDSPDGKGKGGWRFYNPTVSPKQRLIQWGGGSEPKLTFKISEDGETVDGEWEGRDGNLFLVTMTKIRP